MTDKLTAYRHAEGPLPAVNRMWPLYGEGFDNLGVDDAPIEAPMPVPGPDELLVRHDACGLCFSDIKVINQGQAHTRIFKDMRTDPVVLGHEVSMTVVQVGEQLRDQYQVGQRFIVQADIYKDGVNYAYGYMIQGGLSEYGIIDQRVLNGDDGNYLLPVQPETGYAESALTEPWACVIAAYELAYRVALQPGGTMWVIGTPAAGGDYTIGSGFQAGMHPARVILTDVPAALRDWIVARAGELGIEVVHRDGLAPAQYASISDVAPEGVDDIVVLGADADVVEAASPLLAMHGIVCIMGDAPMSRRVAVDVGRVHYHRWTYVGSTGKDIARAYSAHPVRSALKRGGKALFVGAGGPMGRMHVQRAIQLENGPSLVLATDISDLRLEDLDVSFRPEAEARGVTLETLNPMRRDAYAAGMARLAQPGFDDIVVLAPVAAVISEASTYLAPGGVMNVFAGVLRGTMAQIDLSRVYLDDVRIIGHTASSIDDLKLMLFQAEHHLLAPNRSVAAIGSLEAAKDGLVALRDAVYPGKVVIYPNIVPMPITGLAELADTMPTVYAKLRDGREWTVEAENEFLRLMVR
ncbi:MAG: alcohol dehydrogenase catalytic domain-containing protein [Anaerolineae bacterium]|nr:alcohol dehydrogenase catalytic domain-containing protein [Anaerolineae bacterium]